MTPAEGGIARLSDKGQIQHDSVKQSSQECSSFMTVTNGDGQ